jgi:hypothetical protein
MIAFVVIANVDSGPPESNRKPNAKAPSQQTQIRVESFEVQTAQRYVKNLIIGFASKALHVDHSPIAKVFPATTDVLRGTRFSFGIDEGCDGERNTIAFQWTSKSITEPYHQQYIDWITRHRSSKLTPGMCISGCTEHKCHDQFCITLILPIKATTNEMLGP